MAADTRVPFSTTIIFFNHSSFPLQFYFQKFLQKLIPKSCALISLFLSFNQSFKRNKHKQKQLHSKFPSSPFSMQDSLHADESSKSLWKLAHSFSLQLYPQKHIQTSNLFYSRQITCKPSPSPLECVTSLLLFVGELQWASKKVSGFHP